MNGFGVHTNRDAISFPNGFKGAVYSDFVLSTAITFKLSNFYITNLVKCGMNDKNERFKNIASYKYECIQNCYNLFLSHELDIIKPRIIFAFGSSVENYMFKLSGEKYFIQQLPHPAGGRRGFRDEYFKTLYFWLVLRALHKTNILSLDEVQQLTKLFIMNYEKV